MGMAFISCCNLPRDTPLAPSQITAHITQSNLVSYHSGLNTMTNSFALSSFPDSVWIQLEMSCKLVGLR
jgi:hypothetical protein